GSPGSPTSGAAGSSESGSAGVLVGRVVLGLDRPRGRLVLAGGFVLFGLGARLLCDAGCVVHGGVDRVEAQRLVTGVDHVVPGTGGDLDGPSVGDVLLEVELV